MSKEKYPMPEILVDTYGTRAPDAAKALKGAVPTLAKITEATDARRQQRPADAER